VPSDAPSPPAVSCRAVSKVYAGGKPVVALDKLDLEVASGEILVGGRSIDRLEEKALVLYRRREVGIVFQFFNLLPHLTVEQNVALPGRLDGRADAARRARELLERVGLGSRGASHPYELSGGEMQRVAIARSLASGARLLLADEPTGNLDSRNSGEVLRLLDEVRRERGVTLLLATHSAAAAERADRSVAVRDGRIA
jgi:putative ABC transport system ATP-binding protein